MSDDRRSLASLHFLHAIICTGFKAHAHTHAHVDRRLWRGGVLPYMTGDQNSISRLHSCSAVCEPCLGHTDGVSARNVIERSKATNPDSLVWCGLPSWLLPDCRDVSNMDPARMRRYLPVRRRRHAYSMGCDRRLARRGVLKCLRCRAPCCDFSAAPAAQQNVAHI